MKMFTKFILIILILSFIGFILVQGAGVTLRGDSLSFTQGGIINNTDPDLLTITQDVNITRNLTVNQIVVRSPGSIFLGGPNFAIFSASEINGTTEGENFSRITTTINTDFAIVASYNFTQALANLNLNNRGNASSSVSAVNNLFNGIGFLKFNINHTEDPQVGQIGNNFGSFRFFNRNHENSTYTFSFFDEVLRIQEGSNVGVINETRVIEIQNSLQTNPFLTKFFFDVDINQSLNVSGNFTVNNSVTFVHTESVSNKSGTVRMFCKSNNQCFIVRDDGTERRLLDGGGGSIIIDDVWNFVVAPIFENGINLTDTNISLYGDGTITGLQNLYLDGNLSINDLTIRSGSSIVNTQSLTGSYTLGSAYACVYSNGTLFASDFGCP